MEPGAGETVIDDMALLCGADAMKAFLFAVIGAFAVAVLGGLLLSMAQTESAVKFTTESVRLGEPGHNLLVSGDRPQGHSDKRASRD
jgi:hypothetical protein